MAASAGESRSAHSRTLAATGYARRVWNPTVAGLTPLSPQKNRVDRFKAASKSAKLPSSALGRSITETVVHDAGLRSLERLSRAIAGLEIFLVGTGATPP